MINIYTGGAFLDIVHQHRLGGHRTKAIESYLPRWEKGGLGGAVIPSASWAAVNMVVSEIDRSDGRLVLCTSRRDYEERPEGSFGIFMSVEGYEDFAGDLDSLYSLARLGVTTFTFSHNLQNLLCTGSNERFGEGGFSYLGRSTLAELENLPIMVDLVHMSRASFWDAIDLYGGDLFVSHSNCNEVCPHPRNLTDDQIKAVADRNGVIGLNAYRGYVRSDPFSATLDDLLDHAMRMYDLVGPEHMSIGADYAEAPLEVLPLPEWIDPDGVHGLRDRFHEIYADGPVGIEDSSRLSVLLEGLSGRGLKDNEIQQISSGSYLRMLDRTRQAAS